MAIYANLTVDQGSSFESTIDITDSENNPVNLTGYTFRGQIRKTYASTTSVSFTITSISPTSGSIKLVLSAEQTSGIKAGRYLYDVEIISSTNIVTRVIEGQIEVTPRVTRV
jgi:hypothetical protein